MPDNMWVPNKNGDIYPFKMDWKVMIEKEHKIAVVLGIRPDFIRTSKVLKLLAAHPDVELSLIHTGQHYDKNLNEVFFEQLGIPAITHQLDTRGKNHNEQHAKLILQLSDVLEEIQPEVVLFLGDANAVVGCIAPLKLGIPIAHIEAGMRSYNWDMPEERNRVVIDRVSDVLYVYQDDYRVQLVQEGICPSKIVVTGNVIVDVLEEYAEKFEWPYEIISVNNSFFQVPEKLLFDGKEIERGEYALMTLHRNEHMTDKVLAQSIIHSIDDTLFTLEVNGIIQHEMPVVLVVMPRLKALNLKYPKRFIQIEPQGFFEFLRLEKNAAIEFTDSGTNQEVASIVGTPCVVTRDCTERPECGDCGTTVLARPDDIHEAAEHVISSKRNESFSLGDGKSSQRIVDDLIKRLENGFSTPDPSFDAFKARHFRTYS
jgi:UDP-N-acetylglucosamine 2-epimerase (non-hydrolysing)